ncbi:MAG TPA: hypothetical protein VIZ65_13790 [Cellvibrionaceae bacterium]
MHRPLTWDESLINRFDLSDPRYPSYPTTPQFSDLFKVHDLQAAALGRNQSQVPLSIYCHIHFAKPFVITVAIKLSPPIKSALPYLAPFKTETACRRSTLIQLARWHNFTLVAAHQHI